MMIIGEYLPEEKEFLIHISGVLDQSIAEDFSNEYHSCKYQPNIFFLDMEHVDYVDSSILPIIVEFCHYAKTMDAEIWVSNMSDPVLEMFRLLNLHKIFKPKYCHRHYRISWVYHPELEIPSFEH